MNKLLAKLLGILNGLIALIFIVAGAAAGYAVSEGTGLILGLLGGMILPYFFAGMQLSLFLCEMNWLQFGIFSQNNLDRMIVS